ncbi:MAG: carbonate dehydratase [Chitinophagales bacterium]|nr:carbonate dehydratase [Chitinophagales bacterium]
MPKIFQDIFNNNQDWVQKKLNEDPEYFVKLAKGQKPPILWIGCSDSRVPANEITGTQPGEIFVHRNIANMVVHTDMSMLSVLDYAVNVLEVTHVIVCGHYGCGGVNAALDNKQVGLIDNWLRHIKDVYRLHKEEIDALPDLPSKQRRMVELNVQEQVFDLTKTSIIQNAWGRGRFLQVHGLVYDIANGLLKDLNVTVGDNSEIDTVYKFDIQ